MYITWSCAHSEVLCQRADNSESDVLNYYHICETFIVIFSGHNVCFVIWFSFSHCCNDSANVFCIYILCFHQKQLFVSLSALTSDQVPATPIWI